LNEQLSKFHEKAKKLNFILENKHPNVYRSMAEFKEFKPALNLNRVLAHFGGFKPRLKFFKFHLSFLNFKEVFI